MGFETYGDQIHAWIEGVFESRGVNPGKTQELCKKILDYGEDHGDEKLLGFAYYHMGESDYLLNDVDRLFLHMSRRLHIWKIPDSMSWRRGHIIYLPLLL